MSTTGSRTYLIDVSSLIPDRFGSTSYKIADAIRIAFKAEVQDARQWPLIRIKVPKDFEIAFEVWLMCCGKALNQIQEMRIDA